MTFIGRMNLKALTGRSHSRSSDEDQDSSERIGFPQIIDEIFKLQLADRFPRKADSSSSSSVSHPLSSIEEDISKEEKPSISLPQSRFWLIL